MDDYPFENFTRDFDTLHERNVLTQDDLTGNMAEVREYMRETYADAWQRPFQKFVMMMMYLSSHLKDFDTGDYAVYGSDSVGALVSEHILHAVHEAFTEDLAADPTPQEIMRLADKYRET